MIERLAATGSGVPTALVGDYALHSRYNPVKEAEKYIDSLAFREGTRFFILIEPALGYCIPVLRKKNPGAKMIVLHASRFFSSSTISTNTNSTDAVWAPGNKLNLQEFLEQEIPDTEAAAIKIIEWRPSLLAYGEAYRQLLSGTVDFIKRIDANARTVRGFGRRWIKNAFKNIRYFNKILTPSPGAVPLVITGAGPSLEETIPLIRERKQRGPLFVLAASSSVPALYAGNIEPDLVISVDGGGWALFHLYETLRTAAPPIAAGLTAALPSQCAALPLLPLCDGSLWQAVILHALEVPFSTLTQRGTVTATALDLALQLTAGKIFFTGMDLSNRDIQTHARPYGFDRLQEETATRINPRYVQAFIRSGTIAASGSHGIYAAWFKKQLAAYPRRLFSLGNNNSVFDSLKTGFDTDCADSTDIVTTIQSVPLNSNPVSRALGALGQALADSRISPVITGELWPLLFSGEDAAKGSAEKLLEELTAIAEPYGGAPHG